MEQLEAAYQKELFLADKHKKAAADIKKQMEFQQSKTITAKFNAMNMNGAEYERFIHLLASGKKTVLEAADLALNKSKKEVGEMDEN
jgi:hypothetical protein